MKVRIGLLTQRDVVMQAVREAVGAGPGAVVRLAEAADRPAGALRVLDWAQVGRTFGGPGEDPSSWIGAWDAVVCCAGETASAHSVASSLGVRHLVTLPQGGPWLAGQLTQAGSGTVMGVTGLVGGIGTTTIAIACAHAAGECLLVDGDRLSDGLDIPLGLGGGGARLGDIPMSDQPLDPLTLRSGLPRVGEMHVASGARELSPGALTATVGRLAQAARSQFRAGVVDLGRVTVDAFAGVSLDVEVVVAPSSLVGTKAVVRALSGGQRSGRTLVVLRETRWMSVSDAEAELGRCAVDPPTVLALPTMRNLSERADCSDLLGGRVGRALERFGLRVWQACS